MSEQIDVLCLKYHAEGLKYMTALQWLLWKRKKRKKKNIPSPLLGFWEHCICSLSCMVEDL